MKYNSVTHHISVEIAGKDWELAFTISGLEELERIAGRGIMELVQEAGDGKIPTLTFLVDAVRVGLKGAGTTLGRNDVEPLIMSYVRQEGFGELVNVVFACIAASGLMGPEASRNMLESAGITLPEKRSKND